MCSASQEIRVTRFAQPSTNPLACCICWTDLLGRAVFPPWNEGTNFGSYTKTLNYAKLANIEQEEKEAPGKFLDRLREAFCRFTEIDPKSEEERVVLKDRFLNQLQISAVSY